MEATQPASSVSTKVTRWYLCEIKRAEIRKRCNSNEDSTKIVVAKGMYLRRVAEMRRLSLAKGL